MSGFRYVLVREPMTKEEKSEFDALRKLCMEGDTQEVAEVNGPHETAEFYTDMAVQDTLDYLGHFRGQKLTYEEVYYLHYLWVRVREAWDLIDEFALEEHKRLLNR